MAKEFERKQMISIDGPGRLCALCGEPLDDHDKHPSVLRSREDLEVSPEGGGESEDDAHDSRQEAAGVSTNEPDSAPAEDEPTAASEEPEGKVGEGKVGEGKVGEGKGGDGDGDADEDGYVRTDYHPACWEKARGNDYLSFWLAKRPAPPEPEEKISRKERNARLTRLFLTIAGGDDPADDPLRFLVSHLLMRYRVLDLTATRTDENGVKWIQFRQRGTGDHFEIVDTRLSDEQTLGTLQRIDAYVSSSGPALNSGREEMESDVDGEAGNG